MYIIQVKDESGGLDLVRMSNLDNQFRNKTVFVVYMDVNIHVHLCL